MHPIKAAKPANDFVADETISTKQRLTGSTCTVLEQHAGSLLAKPNSLQPIMVKDTATLHVAPVVAA